MAAASARALLLSRFSDFRFSPKPPPPLISLSPRHIPLARSHSKRSPSLSCCLADDYVSTRRSALRREFSVLSNVLRQIEPLDTSVIAQGVSTPAKDSMKRTISTMLGLLPSDHFSVSIGVSRQPLDRLLASSIITGYTLWNAEYRVSLMRNFDDSPGTAEAPVVDGWCEGPTDECKERGGGDGIDGCNSSEGGEENFIQTLGHLSPAALNYIQELKSELATAEKVAELSRPSSPEVEEIIQHLVQSILQRFFKDKSVGFLEDSAIGKPDSCSSDNAEHCDSIGTSRDYLAKLLFWCMLLGHHMKGLEYRMHLSCIVGLL